MMADQATITRAPSRKASRREEFIARVARPGQSAAMAGIVEAVSRMDDATFEGWVLPFLAAHLHPKNGVAA